MFDKDQVLPTATGFAGDRTDQLPRIDVGVRPVWQIPPELAARAQRPGPGNHLVQVHEHLRAETRELLALVARAHNDVSLVASVIPQLDRIASRFPFEAVGSFCSGYCMLLSTHHRIEDQSVFPGLRRRDPSLRPVLAQLFAEHEVVSELIALVHAESERDFDISRLSTLVIHLADQLMSHLAYEESQLVSALNVYLDAV